MVKWPITARRARHLRDYIRRNRCPVGPDMLHHWVQEAGLDPLGGIREWWTCTKCGVVD